MRLHLIIQRHGLPVTRILWTTSSPSNPTNTSAASASAITSTRTPNAAYGGGYTIAQLLEDVNEVVPLETPGGSVGTRDDYDDEEYGGQWGLEDYVVEVNGFECLHFMEVEGLLRDGDEVVIRALQTADLRARRISGRHQISTDGRHLIDGVPFGRPYLKRSFSARPTIKIPPRKRRRISFSGWRAGDDFDEDMEWGLPQDAQIGKQLTLFGNRDDHESDQGTVIRHPPEELAGAQDSESDADTSDFEEEDLAEELNALREDLQPDEAPEVEATGIGRTRSASRGVSQLAVRSSEQTKQSEAKPSETPAPRRSSIMSGRRSESVSTASPRGTKNVRFQKESREVSSSSESDSSSEAESSNTSSSLEESEPSEATTSSEETSTSESDVSTSESEESTSESEEESTSESESEVSTSETGDEEVEEPKAAKAQLKVNPPGKGSARTKKTNRRNKLRRKLAKLKELGLLPADADFASLRAFEEANGHSFPLTEVTDMTEPRPQSKEQLEFEAKRQKLLRDLQSGGVDIDGWSEKENVPPPQQNGLESSEQTAEKEKPAADQAVETTEPSKKRSLDVASSKRLLFGSLGLRTPKTKEDEEAMREKLAAKVKPFVSRREEADKEAQEAASDAEENWQEKLIVRATECVFDDVELTAPPFPFEQRWDEEAHEIIAQRKGWGKRKGRRKRQKMAQAQEQEEYSNGYWDGENGDSWLNYDDEYYVQGEEANHEAEDLPMTDVNGTAEITDDLPALPADISSMPDLAEDQLRNGAIIAFKQLDMSKATNWQPQVSDYRVAEVDSVLEDKTIKVRLAKRDRQQQTDEVEDDEEGPRTYSGFEMPGFDEEMGEDDGFRELSFAELIEPKLLQDVQGVSIIRREDKNRAVFDESQTVPADGAATVSSPTRNEISLLIQDAGFRSKIDSDLLAPDASMISDGWVESVEHDGSVQEEHGDEQDAIQGHDSPSSSIKSPTFAGFPSSPPDVEAGSSPPRSQRSTPSPAAHRHSDRESQASRSASSEAPSPGQGSESRRQTKSTRPVSSQAGSQQPSPASSTVPNPFYEVDRAYEERRAQQSQIPDEAETEEPHNETRTPKGWSDFDILISTAPARTTIAPQSPPEQTISSPRHSASPSEPSNRNSRERTAFHASEVVDLTHTSPVTSGSESGDEDFARSQGLPRGPGWVQKNVPATRRKTRSSTDGGALLDGSSLSPPRSRRRRGRGRGL